MRSKREIKKQAILTISLLSLISLIFTSIPVAQVPGGYGTVAQQLAPLEAATQKLSKIGGFVVGWFETGEKAALVSWLAWVTNSAARNFSTHLKDYVLTNPDPTDPELLRVMGFFISLAQALYILSITLTGFYLLFISGSARGRAKAKYVLGKLVIGMILVTLSPFLLQLLFTFSSSLTSQILEQANLDVVTYEYNRAFWTGFECDLYFLYPTLVNKLPLGKITQEVVVAQTMTGQVTAQRTKRVPLMEMLQTWGGKKLTSGNMNPLLKQVIPSFLSGINPGSSADAFLYYSYFITVVLAILTFGFFAFRYLMTMVWAILLPLSIFFMSFEMTKNIGKTMMEQTFQWTFIQVFYAITLVALSIGLAILPEGYKEGYSLFNVAFYTFAVIAIMFFGPWYLSSLLQRLFPP